MRPHAHAARRATRLTALLAVCVLAATACTGSAADTPDREGGERASASLPAAAFGSPTPDPQAAPTAGAEAVRPQVAPLRARLRPDVLVTARTPLPAAIVAQVTALAPNRSTVVRTGPVKVGGATLPALGIDPSRFRAFSPQGTAESDPVWLAVARGEAVIAHNAAQRFGLPLGQRFDVTGGKASERLRLGALATTNVPGSDVVVSDEVATRLGLAPSTGIVLSAAGGDVSDLAAKVRRVIRSTAQVDLLTPVGANPVAFLTGSRAAKAFGAFSYRYYPDGTIEPDAAWVRRNIRTARVPIIGRVTCHRLMIPQLRGALAEIEARGLASTIKPGEYAGCYVPRFIERNPARPISLHTWGIAADLNVPGNLRGTQGEFDRRAVAIFKKWGFRWGGDWQYTDPMHFELGALLQG